MRHICLKFCDKFSKYLQNIILNNNNTLLYQFSIIYEFSINFQGHEIVLYRNKIQIYNDSDRKHKSDIS